MRERQADFAKRVGVHKSQVTRWKKQGMPCDDDGTLDVETCLEWVANNVAGHEDEDDETTLVALRCKKLRAEIALLELREQRERNELVDRRKAESAVFDLARQERDSWLTWPARVAPEVAASLGADAHLVEKELDRRVREHLRALSYVRIDLAK